MTAEPTIRISEIFGPTIQGEGALIGQPTVFVRTGGCDYRCSWCDTLYAVESTYRRDWKPMNAQAIMKRVKELSSGKPLTITLSGGNPATQDCSAFIQAGKQDGYSFAMETQGSIAQDWFKDLDILTLSPKPPSSGMSTNWDILRDCANAAGANTKVALKIVIANDADYAYAKEAHAHLPHLTLYLQPCNAQVSKDHINMDNLSADMRALVDRITQDQWFTPIILPQLHVYLWGNERGV